MDWLWPVALPGRQSAAGVPNEAGRRIRRARPTVSEDDVARREGADDPDLDVSDPVPVSVPLQNAARKAELPVDAAEGGDADEAEVLVAGGAVGIGVDVPKVDLVALAAAEIDGVA